MSLKLDSEQIKRFLTKTPTQYYAEGIHSQTTLSKSKYPKAHCPTPVFFLFDAYEVLASSNCRFSNGSLGRNEVRIFSTAAELATLPWKQIYHTGWIDYAQPESRSIIFHRHAEVFVPRKLDLEALRFIYCRSEAERETLLHLLPLPLLNQYKGKIIATTRSTLFYRHRTFVEKVRSHSLGISFHFSPDTQSPGPFLLKLQVKTSQGTMIPVINEFILQDVYILPFKFPNLIQEYEIRLLLDDHLAYANTYEEMNVPF